MLYHPLQGLLHVNDPTNLHESALRAAIRQGNGGVVKRHRSAVKLQQTRHNQRGRDGLLPPRPLPDPSLG